jgi:uncharacterized protein (DUF1330 family)
MIMPNESKNVTDCPTFFIAEVEIHDPDKFMVYANQFASTLTAFGGQLLSFGSAIAPLEGIERTSARAAIVVFPSEQASADWFASAEYRKIAPIRQSSASTRAFSVAGLPSAK